MTPGVTSKAEPIKEEPFWKGERFWQVIMVLGLLIGLLGIWVHMVHDKADVDQINWLRETISGIKDAFLMGLGWAGRKAYEFTKSNGNGAAKKVDIE